MRRKKMSIRRYGWRVTVLCGAANGDSGAILGLMGRLGASDKDLYAAGSILRKSAPNFGLTFSSFPNRESVMVIGVADSPSEYFNTVVHESFHLSKHIAQCDGIDPYSEDVAYITGDFVQRVYAEFGDQLCLCGDKRD